MRLPILSVLALGAAACGGPGSTNQNTDATAEVTPEVISEVTPDTTPEAGVETTPEEVAIETTPQEVTAEVSPEVVIPGVSPVTGVDTNVFVTEPERNNACDDTDVDGTQYGATYPWGGLNAGDDIFSCNACPTGLDGLNGTWRAFDGEDFSTGGAASDGVDYLAIDGNTFYTYLRFDGATTEMRGWFMCSQQPEHPNEHLYWSVVESSGDFVPEGNVFRTNKVFSGGDNQRMFEYFNDLVSTQSQTVYYCRVGTRDAEGRLCNDPSRP